MGWGQGAFSDTYQKMKCSFRGTHSNLGDKLGNSCMFLKTSFIKNTICIDTRFGSIVLGKAKTSSVMEEACQRQTPQETA